jgi:hypothetical protein
MCAERSLVDPRLPRERAWSLGCGPDQAAPNCLNLAPRSGDPAPQQKAPRRGGGALLGLLQGGEDVRIAALPHEFWLSNTEFPGRVRRFRSASWSQRSPCLRAPGLKASRLPALVRLRQHRTVYPITVGSTRTKPAAVLVEPPVSERSRWEETRVPCQISRHCVKLLRLMSRSGHSPIVSLFVACLAMMLPAAGASAKTSRAEVADGPGG